MSTLFNKMKKGVTDAGTKAKALVDVNKLKGDIAEIEGEINLIYSEVGRNYFQSFLKNEHEQASPLILNLCQRILASQQQILQLEDQIRELTNEKKCCCGAVVPYETKFCPSCGSPFTTPDEPIRTFCPGCHNEILDNAKFCVKCGMPVGAG